MPREIPDEPEPGLASPPISPPNSGHSNPDPLSPLQASDPAAEINPPQQEANLGLPYSTPPVTAPLQSGQRLPASRHTCNSDPRPSLPDQASPLYCAALVHATTTTLSNQTRQLSIHDHGGRRNSDSPPPGYHKRLRVASPESLSGDQWMSLVGTVAGVEDSRQCKQCKGTSKPREFTLLSYPRLNVMLRKP